MGNRVPWKATNSNGSSSLSTANARQQVTRIGNEERDRDGYGSQGRADGTGYCGGVVWIQEQAESECLTNCSKVGTLAGSVSWTSSYEDVSVDSDDEGIVSSGLKAPQSDLDIPLCKPAGPLSPPVKLQASLPLSTQLERDGHRTWRSESLFDTDESDGDLFPLDPDKGPKVGIFKNTIPKTGPLLDTYDSDEELFKSNQKTDDTAGATSDRLVGLAPFTVQTCGIPSTDEDDLFQSPPISRTTVSHIELQTHKKNDATSMHPHKDPMMKPLTWKTEGLFEVDDAYNDLFEGLCNSGLNGTRTHTLFSDSESSDGDTEGLRASNIYSTSGPTRSLSLDDDLFSSGKKSSSRPVLGVAQCEAAGASQRGPGVSSVDFQFSDCSPQQTPPSTLMQLQQREFGGRCSLTRPSQKQHRSRIFADSSSDDDCSMPYTSAIPAQKADFEGAVPRKNQQGDSLAVTHGRCNSPVMKSTCSKPQDGGNKVASLWEHKDSTKRKSPRQGQMEFPVVETDSLLFAIEAPQGHDSSAQKRAESVGKRTRNPELVPSANQYGHSIRKRDPQPSENKREPQRQRNSATKQTSGDKSASRPAGQSSACQQLPPSHAANDASYPVTAHHPVQVDLQPNLACKMLSCDPLVERILTSHYMQDLEGVIQPLNIVLMPDTHGFNMWGDPCMLDLAEPYVRLLVNSIQDDITFEHFTLSCQYVPLFCKHEGLTVVEEIEERCGVEFLITQQNAEVPIALFACTFAKDFSTALPSSGMNVLKVSDIPTLLNPPPVFVWEWEDDHGTGCYTPYAHNMCSLFSRRFTATPKGSITLKIPTVTGTVEYLVDFDTMTQTNTSTLTTRQIRCILCAPSWLYMGDNRKFVRYSPEDTAEIERMYQAQQPTLLTLNGRKYAFSFTPGDMKQINFSSKFERPIKRECFTNAGMYTIKIQVRGLQSNLSRARKELENELARTVISLSHRLPQDSDQPFHESLLQVTSQYFVQTAIVGNEIQVSGVSGYVEWIKLVIHEKTLAHEKQTLTSLRVPGYWEPQTYNVELKQVTSGSSEWKNVEVLVHQTLPSAQITNLSRIQNLSLWEMYEFSKRRMSEKNGGVVNERNLFHGTRETPPSAIYNSEKGFDFRCGAKGLWGKGAYFAVNATYSVNGYAYTKEGGKQIILALVLTGLSYSSPPNQELEKPPCKPTGDGDFDSVTGRAKGSDIFVVYDHEKAYPAYIITLR